MMLCACNSIKCVNRVSVIIPDTHAKYRLNRFVLYGTVAQLDEMLAIDVSQCG